MMGRETGPVQPTAKQRLQATREALMHELVPSTRSNAPRSRPRDLPAGAAVADGRAAPDAGLAASEPDDWQEQPAPSSGWFAVARHSLRAWWEFHPVRVAGVVAQPVIAEYARQRPLKLVGIAAGLGAALVVIRPWRLVSLGGLAVAALKSSQVSNFALSLLSNRKNTK
ncbi:hypothetical protein GT347_16410 [Xylophilus rhododendri]|uniref:Uncharacterized protein n=1 Tax=Xylophilus rhododendri TaxID=2697032 RepID=A0A857J8L4_9BURK|nr:hypothetical protein [Xylophilus rhododendri]QHI99421.1 hypothetical protein GT347_16410 [Xylophilus rhododendri]